VVDETSAALRTLAGDRVWKAESAHIPPRPAPRLSVACLAAINVQKKEEFLAI
jgi:hypothetical protein